MEKYLIVVGKTKTGYSAHCPDVPGCAATGKTVEETLRQMKGALKFHFEGMVEDGLPVPSPGGVSSYQKILKDDDANDYLLAHVSIDLKPLAAVG